MPKETKMTTTRLILSNVSRTVQKLSKVEPVSVDFLLSAVPAYDRARSLSDHAPLHERHLSLEEKVDDKATEISKEETEVSLLS